MCCFLLLERLVKGFVVCFLRLIWSSVWWICWWLFVLWLLNRFLCGVWFMVIMFLMVRLKFLGNFCNIIVICWVV